MTRQEESLKKRIIQQLSEIAQMLGAGATVTLHEKIEGENRCGLNVKLSYDDTVKTRAKILFSDDKIKARAKILFSENTSN